MKCCEIIELLEQLSPVSYACDWDNVGLLVGHLKQEVKRIFIALDPSFEAICEAVDKKADMLITHHPLLFKPLKKVNDQHPTGQKVLMLAENHIAYYAMHTNFDIMGSMAAIASEKMGIINTTPLEITYETDRQTEGIGKIGNFEKEMTVLECAKLVKERFGLSEVCVYGDLQATVKKVAISPGSGKSMISCARQKGAQLLITGDIGHHEGLDAVEMQMAVIDASHYGLEYIFTDFIKQYLQEKTEEIELVTYDEKRPYQVV